MARKKPGGQLLREWREARDLSQTEAADLLGVDFMTLSRYERGVVRPAGDRRFHFQEVTGGAVPASAWLEPAARAS